jgi:hypothetical protein
MRKSGSLPPTIQEEKKENDEGPSALDSENHLRALQEQ